MQKHDFFSNIIHFNTLANETRCQVKMLKIKMVVKISMHKLKLIVI
jgi:hypothetical protein